MQNTEVIICFLCKVIYVLFYAIKYIFLRRFHQNLNGIRGTKQVKNPALDERCIETPLVFQNSRAKLPRIFFLRRSETHLYFCHQRLSHLAIFRISALKEQVLPLFSGTNLCCRDGFRNSKTNKPFIHIKGHEKIPSIA